MSYQNQYAVYVQILGLPKAKARGCDTKKEVIKFISKIGGSSIRNIKYDNKNLNAEKTLELLRQAKVFSN